MIEIFLGAGFLLVGGFGVWRGLGLLSHAIDNKHERELSRLSTDRMAKSIELEIAQNKAMAEIERMRDNPELPEATMESSPVEDGYANGPYMCECTASQVPHIHFLERGVSQVGTIPSGLLERVRKGNIEGMTISSGRLLSDCPTMKPRR